jgi:hypothetical protein
VDKLPAGAAQKAAETTVTVTITDVRINRRLARVAR